MRTILAFTFGAVVGSLCAGKGPLAARIPIIGRSGERLPKTRHEYARLVLDRPDGPLGPHMKPA